MTRAAAAAVAAVLALLATGAGTAGAHGDPSLSLNGPRLGWPAWAALRGAPPAGGHEAGLPERMTVANRLARSLLAEQEPSNTPAQPAQAHRAGGHAIATAPGVGPSAQLLRTGRGAAEPTLGITSDGTLFYVGFEISGVNQHSVVLRSRDGGRTWEETNPVTPAEDDTISFDPFLYVDKATDRVFNADLSLVACSIVSTSDDRGDTWSPGKVCQHTDHQNLFAGPPPPAGPDAAGYPNLVYYCAIDGGAFFNFGTFTGCSVSLDGGRTFVRTATPPFTEDPRRPGGHYGVPGHCGGNVGHGAVGPDGTVYLPRGWCDQPFVAISRDAGNTWERVQVADLGMAVGSQLEEHEANVAVDRLGNVYYTWIARDRLPYLVTSRDGGATWSKPLMIAAPGVNEAWNVTIDVGEPGRVAFSYVGTTNSPGGPFCVRTTASSCVTADGGPPKPLAAYQEARTAWHGYMGVSADALGADPVFWSATANVPSAPLMRSTACGPSRCNNQLDFLDVAVAPDGSAWAAYVDQRCDEVEDPEATCPAAEGAVGHMAGGFSLHGGPVPDPSPPAPAPPAATPPPADPKPSCTKPRRLKIRARRGARVIVNGRRARVRRGRAIVDLRRFRGRRVTIKVKQPGRRTKVRRVRVCRR
ncbi:MAG TPA: sialidase family protein [Solirubrobacteraceae bacterium]|nr:sialidase family protein [Solirubrobacteraceae bacterium]